jgi:hypothetical protein
MLTLTKEQDEQRLNAAIMFEICERLMQGTATEADNKFFEEYFERYYPEMKDQMNPEIGENTNYEEKDSK